MAKGKQGANELKVQIEKMRAELSAETVKRGEHLAENEVDAVRFAAKLIGLKRREGRIHGLTKEQTRAVQYMVDQGDAKGAETLKAAFLAMPKVKRPRKNKASQTETVDPSRTVVETSKVTAKGKVAGATK